MENSMVGEIFYNRELNRPIGIIFSKIVRLIINYGGYVPCQSPQ